MVSIVTRPTLPTPTAKLAPFPPDRLFQTQDDTNARYQAALARAQANRKAEADLPLPSPPTLAPVQGGQAKAPTPQPVAPSNTRSLPTRPANVFVIQNAEEDPPEDGNLYVYIANGRFVDQAGNDLGPAPGASPVNGPTASRAIPQIFRVETTESSLLPKAAAQEISAASRLATRPISEIEWLQIYSY
jgi:hypothetical protein